MGVEVIGNGVGLLCIKRWVIYSSWRKVTSWNAGRDADASSFDDLRW